MVFDSVIIKFICDADQRLTNSQIEETCKNYTLAEVQRNYAEVVYRRALALGWDHI